MAAQLSRTLESQSNVVIHDWVDDSDSILGIGHTESVITEEYPGKCNLT